jgi:hypothetical protein
MSSALICAACGVQYAAPRPPDTCPICGDVRQYRAGRRQVWLSMTELRARHRNVLRPLADGLTSIQTTPHFAIGQHALLVRGESGNVLWDCLGLIDDATTEAIRELGGITAIAISHPHFYGAMVDWSRAFGEVPIFLHAADRGWVARPDPAILFWHGPTRCLDADLTLVHCGGHFDGATVLHSKRGADGEGLLLSGDVIHVLPWRRRVTFMYSYPNRIPLPSAAIHRIVDATRPFGFERIVGCWPASIVASGGKAVVARAAERYLRRATN